MITETTARQWVVSQASADGKTSAEIAHVATTENTKAITLRFDKCVKLDAGAVSLQSESARDIGNSLIKAADLASAPLTPATA